MTTEKQRKFQFWIRWSIVGTIVIPTAYVVSCISLVFIHGFFGFNMDDLGSQLSNTTMGIVAGIILGFGAGMYQWVLFKSYWNKYFPSPFLWVLLVAIGFALSELLTGGVLCRLDIFRGQINIWNGDNPFFDAAIFSLAGLITGLLQWPLLNQYFRKSGYWVFASMLGWGLIFLATIISMWAFFLGALLYGCITGATLMWILQVRKVES